MLMTTSNEASGRSSCSALPIANVEARASGALAREPNVLLAQIDADVTLRLERAADEVGAAAAAAADLEHVAALDAACRAPCARRAAGSRTRARSPR